MAQWTTALVSKHDKWFVSEVIRDLKAVDPLMNSNSIVDLLEI